MCEWQPGDGAILRFTKSGEIAYGVRRDGEWCHTGVSGGGSAWDDLGGFEVLSPAFVVAHDGDVAPVVIDPEDREAVERLTKALVEAMYAHGKHGHAANGIHPDDVTAALREFANPQPPKPEEPTGLGAVVEDASQVEFIHLGSGLWAYGTTDGPSKGFAYAEIAAVRVLSAGVES